MKEPILSADELTRAARALLMAVLGVPHDIERASVTLRFDESKPGHNALNQMSRRLESELAALLEKLCGEPIYQLRTGCGHWLDCGKGAYEIARDDGCRSENCRIIYSSNRSQS